MKHTKPVLLNNEVRIRKFGKFIALFTMATVVMATFLMATVLIAAVVMAKVYFNNFSSLAVMAPLCWS